MSKLELSNSNEVGIRQTEVCRTSRVGFEWVESEARRLNNALG